MEEIDLKTWKEFEEWVEKLACKRVERKNKLGVFVSEYLFRGQADSSWDLATTLERSAGRAMTLLEYDRIVRATKPQLETFTGTTWEIPSSQDYNELLDQDDILLPGKFPAVEYLIYLRHHGFPSPLLDWTESPYVAAYFAFRDARRTDYVSIYAYCEYTAGHKWGSSTSPTITGLDHSVRSHRRHFQQQSQYTICTINRLSDRSYASHDKVFAGNDDDQDELWKFNIPRSERLTVLRRLKQYNINAFSLFGSEESLMEMLALREIYLRDDLRTDQ